MLKKVMHMQIRFSDITPFNAFPVVLLVLFFSLFFLWNNATIADQQYWIEKRAQMHADFQQGNFTFDSKKHATHPGSFPLLASMPLFLTNFSPLYSIRVTSSLLDTAITMIIIITAFKLRKNKWWLLIAILFVFNDYALFTNPLDIIAAKLITLACLLAFWHFEQKTNTPFLVSILLGITLGLSASTRIHISLLTGLPLLLFLFSFIKFPRFLLIMAVTIISTILSNPYLYRNPVNFLWQTTSTSVNLVDKNSQLSLISSGYFKELNVFSLIIDNPLPTLSLILTIALIYFPRRQNSLPRSFLVAFSGIIMFSGTALLYAYLNNLRFFYPIIFPLLAFLPLFIFTLLNATSVNWRFILFQKIKLYHWFLIIFLLAFLGYFTDNAYSQKFFSLGSQFIFTITIIILLYRHTESKIV